MNSLSTTPTTRVEKIGGDDSFNIENTLKMLRKRRASWDMWVYIFSAFKDSVSEKAKQWNTTDFLIKIAQFIARWDREWALWSSRILRENYFETLDRGLAWHIEKTRIISYVNEQFDFLDTAILTAIETHEIPSKENDYSITSAGNTFSIMGWWEMLVSQIYSRAMGMWDAWIDTYAEIHGTRINDFRHDIATRVLQVLEKNNTAFIPGYSGNILGWLHDKVGRGYSDWTAAHIYAGLREATPEQDFCFMIRKLYGLSSADPRTVDAVQKLTHISYELLLQMIDTRWADAGFVNRAAAMIEIFRNDGYMKIYSERDWSETLITLKWPENPKVWIQFVQDRRVQVVNIRSYNMHKNGYLAFVTDFLAKNWISIIDDTSDAVQINLMVGIDKKMDRETENQKFWDICRELEIALKQFEWDEGNETKVTHSSRSLIFLWGENIDTPGMLSNITNILAERNINLWPVVQTLSPKVIVVGVAYDVSIEAVKRLHHALIEK